MGNFFIVQASLLCLLVFLVAATLIEGFPQNIPSKITDCPCRTGAGLIDVRIGGGSEEECDCNENKRKENPKPTISFNENGTLYVSDDLGNQGTTPKQATLNPSPLCIPNAKGKNGNGCNLDNNSTPKTVDDSDILYVIKHPSATTEKGFDLNPGPVVPEDPSAYPDYSEEHNCTEEGHHHHHHHHGYGHQGHHHNRPHHHYHHHHHHNFHRNNSPGFPYGHHQHNPYHPYHHNRPYVGHHHHGGHPPPLHHGGQHGFRRGHHKHYHHHGGPPPNPSPCPLQGCNYPVY